MSKERIMEIFSKFVDKELEYTELDHVREILTDVCGCSKEELIELGFEEEDMEEKKEEITYDGAEACPNCDAEVGFIFDYDAKKEDRDYIRTCPECGKKFFLCSACFSSDDNIMHHCDWDKNEEGRGCWRGWIPKGE